jgi:hypothetical protein
MAMPGAIETSRSYGSMSAFRKDELEMIREGWTTESFRPRINPDRLIDRILHRHASDAVDAHYLRSDWHASV